MTAIEAEVYKLRAQCKKRRSETLALRKALKSCVLAIRHAMERHPARSGCFTLATLEALAESLNAANTCC